MEIVVIALLVIIWIVKSINLNLFLSLIKKYYFSMFFTAVFRERSN